MNSAEPGQSEFPIGDQLRETEASAASLPQRWPASIGKWLSAVEELINDPESMLVGC
jgi:hypothetical protein